MNLSTRNIVPAHRFPRNFKVELNEGVGGVGTHNGTGKLILPNPDVGAKFFRLLYKRKPVIECHNQKLHFRKLSERPPLHIAQGLDKTPYLDPRIEEELEEKLAKLDVGLHVDKVQFGVYFLEPEDPPTAPRKFSVEFELKHHNRGVGILQFEYLHKLIRIQVRIYVGSSGKFRLSVQRRSS